MTRFEPLNPEKLELKPSESCSDVRSESGNPGIEIRNPLRFDAQSQINPDQSNSLSLNHFKSSTKSTDCGSRAHTPPSKEKKTQKVATLKQSAQLGR